MSTRLTHTEGTFLGLFCQFLDFLGLLGLLLFELDIRLGNG